MAAAGIVALKPASLSIQQGWTCITLAVIFGLERLDQVSDRTQTEDLSLSLLAKLISLRRLSTNSLLLS